MFLTKNKSINHNSFFVCFIFLNHLFMNVYIILRKDVIIKGSKKQPFIQLPEYQRLALNVTKLYQ